MPLVIVTVAEPVPLPEQPPVLVIATARLDDAVAATPNDAPYVAAAGAGIVTDMVWSAFVAVVVSVTSGAAP